LSDSIAINEQLAEVIAKEVEAFQAFKTLMQSEQKALIAGDVDTLTQITEQKTSRVDELNAIAGKRMAKIKELGFTADRDGMLLWIKGAGSGPNALWDSLLELANQIKQLNNINGKLIQTRAQLTQQHLLALLSAINQTASLYGPGGQPDSTPQTNNMRGIIGKA
jgi:flagellar biosynthesis/type III secretory pathway chaperone